MRHYRTFRWRDSTLRIASERYDAVTTAIREQRSMLEDYIARYPAFRTSMVPVPPIAGAPQIALRMHRAAFTVGVGPMAAVAGTFSQTGAEAALEAGAREAIVENGGDIYVVSPRAVTIGLHTGTPRLGNTLGLRIDPCDMPLAVCSSSSTMGHSLSLGRCDLATVVASDAALADAAATHACNLVRSADDLERAAGAVAAIDGIQGVLIVKGDAVAVAGTLPRLVRNSDAGTDGKISRYVGCASVLDETLTQ